ncbi:MAG: hypothetical protein KAU10_09345, partial [Dehalococcoidia bacterium]|nr:hypothetical protein [Dehalococcoidia bacterium]
LLLLMTTSCALFEPPGADGGLTSDNQTNYGDPYHVSVATVDPNQTVFSFGIIADTHINATNAGVFWECDTDTVVRNRLLIDNVNDHCKGCLGVVHLGDMVDAHNVQNLVAFRQLYENDYPGENGGAIAGEYDDHYDAYSRGHRINKPVFPGIGNHGAPKSDSSDDWTYALSYIADRIHGAPGIVSTYDYYVDKTLHHVAYAWRWGRYFFIHLGLWAGSCGYESSACTDHDKLNWLKQLLEVEVGDSGDGVLIFQHYGWDGFSKQKNDKGEAVWWSDDQREMEINVLCGRAYYDSSGPCNPYNVLGIFTGHNHERAWPNVYPVEEEAFHFNNYVFRDSGAESNHYGFSIVDLTGDKLTIRTKNVSSGEWYWYDKDIHLGP